MAELAQVPNWLLVVCLHTLEFLYGSLPHQLCAVCVIVLFFDALMYVVIYMYVYALVIYIQDLLLIKYFCNHAIVIS